MDVMVMDGVCRFCFCIAGGYGWEGINAGWLLNASRVGGCDGMAIATSESMRCEI
jgi:hypothetical protein